MKGSVRCNAITLSQLKAQEAHGKRTDKTSERRRVRDKAPLIGGGLDLVTVSKHTQRGRNRTQQRKM